MAFKEKDFQRLFSKWLKHRFGGSGAFELKITQGGRALPFSAVQDHQKEALFNAHIRSIVYKIDDSGIGQKPFDCFKLDKVPAYVVVMYYQRGCKHFYMIDIETWIREKKNSHRKSLTEDRAKEIGKVCVLES